MHTVTFNLSNESTVQKDDLEIYDLGGGFNHFAFSRLPGEMIQFDYSIRYIFQIKPPTSSLRMQVVDFRWPLLSYRT